MKFKLKFNYHRREKVEVKLDYWMYEVIEKALKKQLERELLKYGKGAEEMTRFMHNRFIDVGATNLCLEKIRKMREAHSDEVIKSLRH